MSAQVGALPDDVTRIAALNVSTMAHRSDVNLACWMTGAVERSVTSMYAVVPRSSACVDGN